MNSHADRRRIVARVWVGFVGGHTKTGVQCSSRTRGQYQGHLGRGVYRQISKRTIKSSVCHAARALIGAARDITGILWQGAAQFDVRCGIRSSIADVDGVSQVLTRLDWVWRGAGADTQVGFGRWWRLHRHAGVGGVVGAHWVGFGGTDRGGIAKCSCHTRGQDQGHFGGCVQCQSSQSATQCASGEAARSLRGAARDMAGIGRQHVAEFDRAGTVWTIVSDIQGIGQVLPNLNGIGCGSNGYTKISFWRWWRLNRDADAGAVVGADWVGFSPGGAGGVFHCSDQARGQHHGRLCSRTRRNRTERTRHGVAGEATQALTGAARDKTGIGW